MLKHPILSISKGDGPEVSIELDGIGFIGNELGVGILRFLGPLGESGLCMIEGAGGHVASLSSLREGIEAEDDDVYEYESQELRDWIEFEKESLFESKLSLFFQE